MLASAGGLLALVIVVGMYAKSMHVVGLPLPAALDDPAIPPALIIWIDMAFWASLVVFSGGRLIGHVTSLVRREREPSAAPR